MKIVRIHGGLGNQMFQYAFGLGYEEHFGEKILFDCSWFDSPKKQIAGSSGKIPVRKLELGIFPKMRIDLASPKEIDVVLGGSRNYISKAKRALNRWFKWNLAVEDERNYYITDENALYDDSGWPLGNEDRNYYCGYWQKLRYFEDIEPGIRNFFQFPDFTEDYNKRIAEKIIESSSSVCLHVRRGDYLNFGWQLPATYYQKAVKYICEHIPNVTFFVFGQHCEEFIKKELQLPNNYLLIGEENSYNHCDYRDMQLMSLCKHSIIANSSFSWWGAYLAQHSSQVVVAPSPWINEQEMSTPGHWVKIHL